MIKAASSALSAKKALSSKALEVDVVPKAPPLPSIVTVTKMQGEYDCADLKEPALKKSKQSMVLDECLIKSPFDPEARKLYPPSNTLLLPRRVQATGKQKRKRTKCRNTVPPESVIKFHKPFAGPITTQNKVDCSELIESSSPRKAKASSVSSSDNVVANSMGPDELNDAIERAEALKERHIKRTLECFDCAFKNVGKLLYENKKWAQLHKNKSDLECYTRIELKQIRDEVRAFVHERVNTEAKLQSLSDMGWV